jgi:hypothetical protein
MVCMEMAIITRAFEKNDVDNVSVPSNDVKTQRFVYLLEFRDGELIGGVWLSPSKAGAPEELLFPNLSRPVGY